MQVNLLFLSPYTNFAIQTQDDMLRNLHIQNYALIESLNLDFAQGFAVITGETGAGKSILLGAIGLLTGQRAETAAIRTGAT